MKAVVLYGPYDIRVEEVPKPRLRSGWVRVKVEEVGICGTDKAFYKGTYRPLKIPIIPGHEIAGVVDDVGEGVPRDIIGLRVTTEINVACGKCWFCRHGMKTHCPYREVIGISIDGGMAEYLITPYENIHIISRLSPEEGAFVEPLAAVIEMVKMEPPEPGSNIAVLGSGTIGLLSLQVLKLMLPKKVVVITRPNSPKALVAKELGADEVISVNEVKDYIKENTPEGQGFDYVVEATGSPQGLDLAVNITRPRGVIAAKSTHGAPTTFNYTLAVVKELRIIGSRCGPFKPAIKLLEEGRVNVKKLITGKYPLSEARKAFEDSLKRESIKIHLIPG